MQHIDIGGGLGIQYRNEEVPSAKTLIASVRDQLDDLSMELMIEPGRSIVGNAGALLTRVMLIKEGETKHFAVVDAAMNDLLRPALYSAWQTIMETAPAQNKRGYTMLLDRSARQAISGQRSRAQHY